MKKISKKNEGFIKNKEKKENTKGGILTFKTKTTKMIYLLITGQTTISLIVKVISPIFWIIK